ncbi:MAG: hypothetical protein ACH6QP_01060 [Candidatus Carsonella ruddii]
MVIIKKKIFLFLIIKNIVKNIFLIIKKKIKIFYFLEKINFKYIKKIYDFKNIKY